MLIVEIERKLRLVSLWDAILVEYLVLNKFDEGTLKVQLKIIPIAGWYNKLKKESN